MEGGDDSGGALPVTLGLVKRKVPAEQRVHCEGFKLRGGCVPAPLNTVICIASILQGSDRRVVLVGAGTLESGGWKHHRGDRGDAY
jgi:hypothetical protein